MSTTIIIPCKDGLNYTKNCLMSIFTKTKAPFKVIVVDDGSTEETKIELRKIKNITLLENTSNMGFPKSCNVGMRAVKTKYFVLMNNDVEVTKGWLSMLLEVMEKNPELGILGPKTNSVSGPQHDPNAHYNCNIGLEQYAYEVKKRKPPRIEPFPRIVFFCVLIRSKLYKKIGGLDEKFGLGNFEDDDYCLRAHMSGYKAAIDHNVFVHHYGSKTFSKLGKGFSDLLIKNKAYFMKKWGSSKI